MALNSANFGFSDHCQCGHFSYMYEKKVLYLSVNVFSMKALVGDTPTGSRAKALPPFLSHFKTMSVGPVPGIEPATSHSPVKRSTD